ncbi:ABC1 kinase family protein [Clostridium tarantellae]|uniref:AarF/ABC1/UbiB kinase family protein n=1 Tax=Clostridium tarantellae TaxID=39493 RepID=A0A6I1MJY2_9CLOT|nr:AarF/UbiB family protein [Clostridium tarantellae]MPQ43695.1 AarF/ABC1/UbiB kinase family protein [Clostridium tarantellae]
MKESRVNRFKEIVKVFTHYGFGYVVNAKKKGGEPSPVALRKAFEELGATFIKLGQILSTRPDILPKEYIKELEKLQDCNIYTDNIETVKKVFYEDFGKNIEDYFLYFSPKPLASASIAQVHKGILKDGTKVVVKIQHSDIKEKMNLDLAIIKRIVKLVKHKFNNSLINPMEAINEIEESTKKELNFLVEYSNMVKFREFNEGVVCITSPQPLKLICSERVLTMEEIDGFKISEINKLYENGYDREDIAKKLSLSFCKQIFDDGFFHGDPHPGNLLISNRKIVYIDFGIVGQLDKSLKKAMNKAITYVALEDVDGIVSFILTVGVKTGEVDESTLRDDCKFLLTKYTSISLSGIKISEFLNEIFDISSRNNIQLPKEFVSLIRSVIILEGVLTNLDPDLEIMDVIISFIKNKDKLDLLDKLTLDDIGLKLYKFTLDGFKIPSKINELADSISKGRVKVKIEVKEIKNLIFQLNKMVNRLSFALVVGCMVIASSLVLKLNTGPLYDGLSLMGVIGYAVSAIFGFWLLISIIKSGFL